MNQLEKTFRNKTKWYTPKEIAKLGMITTSKGSASTVNGNYAFVMRLINSGQILARNYSTGSIRPNWLVSDKEIERYNSGIPLPVKRKPKEKVEQENAPA